MLNHARTLLANLDGNAVNPALDYPSIEPVDKNYKSLRLKSIFADIRKILFGSDPDLFYILYRTEQLMRVIHSTEYASYVTELDNRITYDLSRSELFDYEKIKIDLVSNGSPYSEATKFKFSGDLVANDVLGRGEYLWELQTYNTTFMSAIVPFYDITEHRSKDAFLGIMPELQRGVVKAEDISEDAETGKLFVNPGLTIASKPPDFESFWERLPGGAGLRFKFELPTNLKFICYGLFSDEAEDLAALLASISGIYPTNSRWLIRVRCRPTLDISYILRAMKKFELALLSEASGLGEPFQTFINLYQNHYALPYKLTGLLLIYIYLLNRQLSNVS